MRKQSYIQPWCGIGLRSTLVCLAFLICASGWSQSPIQKKFVRPDDARFDLNRGAFVVESYANEKNKAKGIIEKSKKSTFEIKNISGQIPHKVYEVLVELGYIDTVHHFFPDYKTSLKLDYIVHEIVIKSVGFGGFGKSEVNSKATITLKSQFGLPIFTKETKTTKMDSGDSESDLFYESVYESVKDFFSEADVAEFMKNDAFVDLPKFDSDQKIELIGNKVTGADLTQWTDAVVTLIDSLGHGSGCVVGSDGYIITNYHVVSRISSIRVKFQDGRVMTGKVLRYDPECDLALVKVDARNLRTFDILEKSAIGDVAFVLGTPVDTLLNQSVSKGIISGNRNYYGIDYLQTDANINSGNSGGALLNANGQLLGIVNAKYFGYGIEGIGFAIPAKYAMERLMLVNPARVDVINAPASPNKKKV